MQANAALPTSESKITEKTKYMINVPEFKVSGVYSSHMVLQRDKEIRIFGFSDTNGSHVRGEFDGETAEASVENNCFTKIMALLPSLIRCIRPRRTGVRQVQRLAVRGRR